MKNFKLPHIRATRNKRNFTATTKYYANRDENDRLIKNKALFELNPDVKTSSHLANEKSQSSDQLFDLLKKTSKNHWITATQLNYLCMKRRKYVVKQVIYFQKNKSSLTDLKRKEAEYNIDLNAVGSSHHNHNTEEEKSLFEIDRYLKRSTGAMYRAKSVQEVVPNPHATNDTVTKAEKSYN